MRDRLGTNSLNQEPLPAYSYLRLSDEERKRGDESSSISNQRKVIKEYAAIHNIVIVGEYSDDGFSGGNFDRPGFQRMIKALEENRWVRLVITKDLSRLGRDMQESSYYAETYFPEHGVQYLAPGDNFDNYQLNVMAPFNFAFNDVYLRQGSQKVREVLKTKRNLGEYCACPPYGYAKMEHQREGRLVPDEVTAPIVKRIFDLAAQGESSRSIAQRLNSDKVIPPLKYRVLYRDDFTPKGASYASDQWNGTTVKRILKNQVYLGHTILGKFKKPSLKSKKKIALPEEEWTVHRDTHEPLVTPEVFERAQINMANKTRSHYDHPQVRKSIFGKIAFCAKCGHAMCSAGTVYKGEREKYWYLACNRIREKDDKHCEGVRIRYADLVELVRNDLNRMLAMTDEEVEHLVNDAITAIHQRERGSSLREQISRLEKQLRTAEAGVAKAYADYAEGKLSGETLEKLVSGQESTAQGLRKQIKELEVKQDEEMDVRERYDAFYQMARRYTHVETLDRDTLLTFVERIEIGPKKLPEGCTISGPRTPFRQEVKIFYRFIGAVNTECSKGTSSAMDSGAETGVAV